MTENTETKKEIERCKNCKLRLENKCPVYTVVEAYNMGIRALETTTRKIEFDSIHCAACGRRLKYDAKFCDHCGRKIEAR